MSDMQSESLQLLTSRQTAELLAISERTLWTLTRDGTIPAVRLGRSVRYRSIDIETALRSLSTSNDPNNGAA